MSEILSNLNLKAEALMRRQREKREEEIRREQREADAALVRAAGCICLALYRDSVWGTSPTLPEHPFAGEILWRDGGLIVRHDARCPEALAAAILEGKP